MYSKILVYTAVGYPDKRVTYSYHKNHTDVVGVDFYAIPSVNMYR